nr:glycerophosphodiester phosphodiesterase [Candidatus Sigynarchaeota archaeon]
MEPKHFTFEIIGHRGCEGLAPENSIAAMERAIELHIDRVEFDVLRTRDRDLVVMHDNVVRAGMKLVPASEMTRGEILRARKKMPGEVATLQEVLETCRGRIKIQAELKADEIEAGVWALITSTGFPLGDVSISSFDINYLARMRTLAPDLGSEQLVYLLGKDMPVKAALDTMRTHRIGSISIHARDITADAVREMHEQGVRVLAWGLGEKRFPRDKINSTYQSLLRKGLDGFTCAYPDLLQALVWGAKPSV